MRKVIVIILALTLVVVVGLILPTTEEKNYDYLRLHIRANSNTTLDQDIKYDIKSMLVEFLTPYLVEVESKEQAIEKVESMRYLLKTKCDKMLSSRGFNYSSNILVRNEYFPTRTYSNVTLESGYYDAVIVELGSAEGDNWWCLMYPPLCFVNKFENTIQINYKSKIVEWFEAIFN